VVLVSYLKIAKIQLRLSRVALNVLYCHKVNRDKVNGKYDQYVGFADDRNPDFIMVL
jgi:hypothetical protein